MNIKRWVAALLLSLTTFAIAQDSQPPGCGASNPRYVFTRTPVHKTPIGAAINGSNWQHFSDVGRVHDFAESEIAMLTTSGTVRTLHKQDGCAAHEPKVSPDGTKVAYALSCGVDRPLNYLGIVGAMVELHTTRSSLWVYDLSTHQKYEVTSGHYDRQPEWCGNDCLLFPSDRGGTYAPQAYNGIRYGKAWQIHKGTLKDNKLVDIKNINHHSFFSMSPAVTSSGEVLYSCWRGEANPFDNLTSKPSPNNHWNICAMDLNGANGRVVLGHHWLPAPLNKMNLTREKGSWTGGQELTGRLALRPPAEIAKDRYASGSYYRGNGPGEVLCFDRSEQEGMRLLSNVENAYNNKSPAANVNGSGLFVPKDIEACTPFAQAFDLNLPRINDKGEWGGRTSHPAAGPNGRMLFTWGHDFCYEAVQGSALQLGCNRDIYLALNDVVLDPKVDATCVTCDPDWHELDAQWIAPYEEKFGVPFPTIEPLTGEKCFYVVDDARKNELYNIPDYASRVGGIQWTPYTYHRSLPQAQGIGTPGTPITVPLQENSGAIVQEVPCETPLLTNAVDKQGVPFAHDPMLHSLRKGETRRCAGCHEDHSEERVLE